MSLKSKEQIILEEMLTELELPETAYEKAISRYEDIGEWFSRDESGLKGFDPHIFPQGSFRLGTANKPLSGKDEYDLDLSCKLRVGITKSSHTQEQLKEMIRQELEAYRVARGISKELEPKHRCWRLEYQDKLSFHIDIVPCIPEETTRREKIRMAIIKSEGDESVAAMASDTTVAITDDRDQSFKKISDDWKISNPEGFSTWFESKMRSIQRYDLLEKAQVDDVPLFKKKSPLQQVIQILKRHRDIMFKDDEDSKPISIIITTLASRAYNGESSIADALMSILETMGTHVNSNNPRVPNPVDPEEDFADRWVMDKYKHLNLEQNFWNWLTQAKSDFRLVLDADNVSLISEQAKGKFSLHLDNEKLEKSLGISATPKSEPRIEVISEKNTAKPWKIKS